VAALDRFSGLRAAVFGRKTMSGTLFSRRSLAAGALAALLSLGASFHLGPASAHAAKCPYCKLDVPQDTDQQDNEVALRFGRKRIEYRCVFCALAQAKTDYKGDLSVLAPTELKGKPALLSRKDDKWSVLPESAVFVGQKASHQQCQVAYRAFTTRAAFDAYVKAHKDVVGDAKPLTLAQMVELAK
jgi:hypothetical protein